jgi:hypothetical protein
MDNIADVKPLIGARARPGVGVLVIGLVASVLFGALLGQLVGLAAASMRSPDSLAAGTQPALYVQTTTWTAAGATATGSDAPAPGTRRLFLETVVNNFGRDSASVAPRTFAVRASDGRSWPLTPSTAVGSQPPAAALQPGEQRSLNLFADLPAGAQGLRLTWTHRGQSDSVPVL